MPDSCDRACQVCLNNLCTHKIPIFSTLPHEALEQIALRIQHRDMPAGSIIIEAGARSDRVTILSEGRAKAYRYTADGREQILYVFSAGDFFGERDLLLAQESPYQIEALTPVKLCQLSGSDFQDLLREHADIALQIVQELGRRLSRLELTIQNMGNRSIDARISATLLDFADQYGLAKSPGILLKLPLSREGLASYMGIARETVSRKLSQLESEGIIEAIGHKTIWIKNVQAMKVSADLF